MGHATVEQPIEVRVYRFGSLKVCEWCATDEHAARVVDMWQALGGVRCEIDGTG